MQMRDAALKDAQACFESLGLIGNTPTVPRLSVVLDRMTHCGVTAFHIGQSDELVDFTVNLKKNERTCNSYGAFQFSP